MAVPRPAGRLALVRLRVSGVVFLVVIALLVGLSVALYNKAFTDVVTVRLQADRAGNQLSAPTDVKMRGLIVGEVRSVESDGDGATIELALQPDKVDLIPADVQAQLLPKTLFGEKFVSLVSPVGGSTEPIAEGDVIGQDRSTTSIETARVLDDLVPLLKALGPDDLSRTLNALSGALRGRGERIGENAVLVQQYLAQLNPALPTIQRDLVGLADLADTYDQAAPDLLAVLDDLSFSARSLVDQQEELAQFLDTTSSFTGSLDSLLQENEQRLIRVASESVAPLQLFADYSPGFGCFLQGFSDYQPIVEKTFGGLQPGLHITLVGTIDQGPYAPGDEPEYVETGPPDCRGLPNPQIPAPDEPFGDGYRDETEVRAQGAVAPTPVDSPAGQRRLANAVLGASIGQPVGDLAMPGLLVGPLARGTTVGVR